MNVVVIVIDTLRHDFIRAHGARDVHTPNLDRLADGAWVFDNSYSASYPTIPHRTDAMTGRYGSPLYPWMPLRHDVVTLPWTMAEAGYCTQLIHDTPHLVNGGHNFDWPFHAWTFVHGAEVDRPWIDDSTQWLSNWARDPMFDCIDTEPLSHPMTATYARANRGRRSDDDWNCAQLFSTAARFAVENRSRENFFLWLDCFDPHEPWDAPPEFMLMYDRAEGYDGMIDPRSFIGHNHPDLPHAARERVKASYAAKVTWVDHCFGRFMDALETTGLIEKTAVLLTADHGTRLYEYGKAGKTFPVREQEAHTPFIVHVPGDPGGRSSMVVQPQDIFATVAGIAGVPVPGDMESHDVVAAAREGLAPRQVAIAGRAAGPDWDSEPGRVLFTVFDGEWALEWTRDPADCRLQKMGGTEDVASQNPGVVEQLHAVGLDEISRRGTDRRLLSWLKSEGGFPPECAFWEGHPGPVGFRPYFSRIYVDASAG